MQPTYAGNGIVARWSGWRATRYYRIRFRRRLPSCTQHQTIRPSARRNFLSSNRLSYSEPAIATERFITAAWLLLLRAATSFARRASCSVPFLLDDSNLYRIFVSGDLESLGINGYYRFSFSCSSFVLDRRDICEAVTIYKIQEIGVEIRARCPATNKQDNLRDICIKQGRTKVKIIKRVRGSVY